MDPDLEKRFYDRLVTALAAGGPQSLGDLAGELAEEAADYRDPAAAASVRSRGWAPGLGKKPVEAHSRGRATHNRATIPGELEVTIWGTVDKEPDRPIALTLGEEDIKQLIGALSRYGFPVP